MRPIHNHSHYSALDGYGTPEEIAARIKGLGLPGAALTDHGTVAGWNSFRKAMEASGLECVYGIEAYQAKGSRLENPGGQKRDQAHLILLAKTLEGYKNIKRLSNEAHRSGFYYAPRVDWELLERFREGVICTSACMGGLLAQAIMNGDPTNKLINEYLRRFGDDFYIELHTYSTDEQKKINKALCGLAQEHGIPLLIANDAHYPTPDDYVYHEVMLSVQEQRQFDVDKPRHPPDLYIMDEADIRNRLSYLHTRYVDEAITMTDKVFEDCQFDIPVNRMHLPKFQGPKDSNEYLIDLVEAGIYRKYGSDPAQEVIDRAEYEMEEIIKAKLADYFLIVRDFVLYSRSRGILVGAGRGSVGGSIIAYCMDITEIDPLRYGLFFERFWNPGRAKGFPDIDVDFEDLLRDEIKTYLSEKYGENRVISIGTYQTLGPKGALKDCLRVLYDEVPFKDQNAISTLIDKTTRAGIPAGWEEIWDKIGKDLAPWEKKYPDAFEAAQALTGRIRNYSTHASAVVISDVDLEEELPGRADRKEKTFVTQVDMGEVEELGFLKMDLLGLRNLTTLREAAELAGHPNFDFRTVHNELLDAGFPDDFWEMLDHGLTLGLFQIEDGAGAKGIVRAMKPRSVEELGLAVALNRPGALESGATERYLDRLAGKIAVRYPHAILEPILQETLGEIVYQEQVIAYLKAIGYSLGEADEVRKMMGKKKVKDMEAEYPRYLNRAKNHMTEKQAENIWHLIENFSRYGFNKSHAIGYGIILLWSMYAKYYWTTQFFLASIQTADKNRVGSYIAEARTMGIHILPPDINMSEIEVTDKDGDIYYGLSNIKGVGRSASSWIVANRPYSSKQDLIDRLEAANLDWKERELPGLSPKTILKSNMIQALWDAGAFDRIEDRKVDDNKKIELEEELLGVTITDVVTPVVERHWEEIQDCDTLDALDGADSEFKTVVGVISGVRVTKVNEKAWKNPGREMAFISLEWQQNSATIVAFPDEYDSVKYMLKKRTIGKFDLRLGAREPQLLRAEKFV